MPMSQKPQKRRSNTLSMGHSYKIEFETDSWRKLNGPNTFKCPGSKYPDFEG